MIHRLSLNCEKNHRWHGVHGPLCIGKKKNLMPIIFLLNDWVSDGAHVAWTIHCYKRRQAPLLIQSCWYVWLGGNVAASVDSADELMTTDANGVSARSSLARAKLMATINADDKSDAFTTFPWQRGQCYASHYSDDIMSATASQITGLSIVCSAVCSGTDQRKHQSSVSLAFVRGIHWWPVNFPHKGPATRKLFPFDDVVIRRWLIITAAGIIIFFIKLLPF